MSIGAAILHCWAIIETPAVRVGDAHWLSMDGVIFVKGEQDEEAEVHCRFTYCREHMTQIITAGKYNIMAMVSDATAFSVDDTFLPHAMASQVIGIHEQTNCTLFELRGDIFSVSLSQCSLCSCP